MVKLIRNRVNKIPIAVTSLIDYSGFSAMLEVSGLTKTVSNLKSAKASVEFSAEEIESMFCPVMGTFTVYDKEGEVHAVYKIYFGAVDSEGAALGFQKLRVVIVSSFKYDWDSHSGGGEAVRELSKRVDKVEEDMKDKVSVYYDESDDLIGFEDGHGE